MLFRKLDKIKRDTIMMAIMLMLIGNILLILPEESIPMLGAILGFLLLVVSLVSVYNYLSSAKALISYIRLSVGLFAGLIGLMLIIFDSLLISALSMIVAVLPTVLGIYGIYHAIAFARRSGRKGWWVLIILSAFLLAFADFIFLNPWTEPQAIVKVIGGTMMYSAFVSAVGLIWLWPVRKEQEEDI